MAPNAEGMDVAIASQEGSLDRSTKYPLSVAMVLAAKSVNETLGSSQQIGRNALLTKMTGDILNNIQAASVITHRYHIDDPHDGMQIGMAGASLVGEMTKVSDFFLANLLDGPNKKVLTEDENSKLRTLWDQVKTGVGGLTVKDVKLVADVSCQIAPCLRKSTAVVPPDTTPDQFATENYEVDFQILKDNTVIENLVALVDTPLK